MAISAPGRQLVNQTAATFEAEIAELVADLSTAQRGRLSAIASLIVAADAQRRGIDIVDTDPAPRRTRRSVSPR